MEPLAIFERIEKAFPEYPMPEMSLRQALLSDQSLTRSISEDEWCAERLKDGLLTWRQLTDADLMECRDGLAHLDEEAFAYYAGALLKSAIQRIDLETGTEAGLLSSIVFSFTSQSNYNLARLKRLN